MLDKNREQLLINQVEELYRYVIQMHKTFQDMQTQIAIENLKFVNLKYEISDTRSKEKMLPLPIIRNGDELLNKLLTENKSLARFGDGEFSIMGGLERCAFQHLDKKLAERLQEVITSDEEKLLIGIADNYGSLEQYTERAAWAIRAYMSESTRQLHWKFLKEDKIYYDAYLTRPFLIYKDKTDTMLRFQKIKLLWKDRNVIMVEGAKTRFGVGNDLFNNVRTIKRILAPATNSFDRYDDILHMALRCTDKDVLFLVALGPSAGVLVYDLCKNGYQAIDIGHLDIEYEWFIHGQEQRGSVKYKYNSEVVGGDNVDDSELPKEYFTQIIGDCSD